MNIKLEDNERIDDLEWKNLKIIQNTDGFCFGIDSVLLSDFSKNIKENSIIADFGTGTGIVSILLSKKVNPKKIYGIEIQEEVAKMATKSVKLNNLDDVIEIKQMDIKETDNYFELGYFNAIVTNPPYKKLKTGLINDNEKQLISRHEVKCSLNDIVEKSFRLLKDKGELYMINRPERLVDIIDSFRKNKIEPKILRLVYSKVNSKPNLVLIKGVKNAKPSLIIEEPLIIYNEKGDYTDEILKIYHKK